MPTSVVRTIHAQQKLKAALQGTILLACPFHTAAFPHSIALVSEKGFTIGAVHELSKLHSHSFSLAEQPRRIAHHVNVAD